MSLSGKKFATVMSIVVNDRKNVGSDILADYNVLTSFRLTLQSCNNFSELLRGFKNSFTATRTEDINLQDIDELSSSVKLGPLTTTNF